MKYFLTDEQIKFLNKYVNGKWSVNQSEGLVDIDGNFYCFGKKIENFCSIRFGKVSGNFHCYENNLTSLEGAPQEVGGNFNCYDNNLSSLEGAPKKVGGSLFCSRNKITSLEGSPRRVDGDFSCTFNNLTSLEGAPQEVGGIFYCQYNNLTSLKGAPQKVVGNFICYNNKFVTLNGAPPEVGGYFMLIADVKFLWTTTGKLDFSVNYPECIHLLLPTIPYDSILSEAPLNPPILGRIEEIDKTLYTRILEDLGWDKMGPDLLRQLKNGII